MRRGVRVIVFLLIGFLYASDVFAQCAYQVSPTAITVGPIGGDSTVTITTDPACAWTATTQIAWGTVLSGASGTGPGTATFRVGASLDRRQGTLTVAGQTVSVIQRGGATSDFDGDGIADPTHFRNSDATWQILLSTTGTARVDSFGASGDLPVPADYDGDGVTDEAVYRPSTGHWLVLNSSTQATVDTEFGSPADTDVLPIPADYDNDGKADLAFTIGPRRSGTSSRVAVRNSGVLRLASQEIRA